MLLQNLYSKVCRNIKDAVNKEEGQGLVEYGFILVFIAMVVIGALIFIGDEVREIFYDITAKFESK